MRDGARGEGVQGDGVEQNVDTLAAGYIVAHRWRIVRRIGGGSMGAVYEASHVLSGDRAALKVMHPQLLADDDLRRRFRQEALVTAAVSCEHIVEAFDAGTDPESHAPYLATELLAGIDLAERLERLGIPPQAEAIELLMQIAIALESTHAAGIVHRDVTPKNVFVTARPTGALCVKMLDFGVAKVIATSPYASATLAAGTPFYMSPEQIRGDGDIDAASDRFALGQLAFTLLTGAPYWQDEHDRGDKAFQLVSAMLGGPVEAPRERALRRGISLPAGFDAWFARATHRERAARFASADEQIRALAETLGVPLAHHPSPTSTGRVVIDGAYCEALAARATLGDDGAWQTLVSHLWPFWLKTVRRHREMGSLAKQEDHVNDVVARLVEKMSPRAGAALGAYPAWRERNPDKGFEDWLRIVTAFTVRDHVRRTLGRGKRDDPDMPSAKRLLNEFVASPSMDEAGGWNPSYTTAQLAQRLITFARERLSEPQFDALTLWLQGADHDEIAAQQDTLDAEAARKLLRSAVAVLRRQFQAGA